MWNDIILGHIYDVIAFWIIILSYVGHCDVTMTIVYC